MSAVSHGWRSFGCRVQDIDDGGGSLVQVSTMQADHMPGVRVRPGGRVFGDTPPDPA